MLTSDEESEVKEILAERKKWKYFFEILRRPYVFVPTIIIFVCLVDNPNFYINKIIINFFQKFINGF
jgi:hypothetical protein